MNVCIAALLQCVAIYSIKELELRILIEFHWASLIGKESTCNAGDLGLIPGLGRSPREGKGYLLQYSDLANSLNCIVHRVTKSWTRLSDFDFQGWIHC